MTTLSTKQVEEEMKADNKGISSKRNIKHRS